MANNTMIKVNGVPIATPSTFTWGLTDVSDSQSGRTQDSLMHKNRVAQKRKIQLGWNNPSKETAASILQAFNPEYIDVTYPDAMSGNDETRTFYVGDRSAPKKMWTVNKKIYSQISFNIIER